MLLLIHLSHLACHVDVIIIAEALSEGLIWSQEAQEHSKCKQ